MPLRIALERGFLLGRPRFAAIGAGNGDGVGADAPARLLNRLFRDDIADGIRQRDAPRGGERLVKNKRAGALARDFDMAQRPPIGLVGRFDFGIDDALERVFDILGRHRAEAVGETGVFAQRERDSRVVDLLDFLRGVQSPAPFRARLVLHKFAVDGGEYVLFRHGPKKRRIHRLRVAVIANPQNAVLRRRRRRRQRRRKSRRAADFQKRAPINGRAQPCDFGFFFHRFVSRPSGAISAQKKRRN